MELSDQPEKKPESLFINIAVIIFSIGMMLSIAKRIRFMSEVIGPSEIAVLISSTIIICQRAFSKARLMPSRTFIICWAVFWACAITGCITRTFINDITPPGFAHNLLAFIYLTGLTYIIPLIFSNTQRTQLALKVIAFTATPFYLLPYILGKLGMKTLLGRDIYFAGWTGPRLEGFTMNPNQLGFIAVVLMAISFYLLTKSKGWLTRGLSLLCFAINILLIFDSRSSSAIAALLSFPAILLILLIAGKISDTAKRISWRGLLKIILPIFIILAVIFLAKGPQLVQSFSNMVNKYATPKIISSWDVRRPLYSNTAKILRESPVWGYGFGGQTGHVKVFGGVSDAYESHNTFLDIALTAGATSMLIWFLLCLRALWQSWKNNDIFYMAMTLTILVFSLGNNVMRQPLLYLIVMLPLLCDCSQANQSKPETTNDA